MYVKHYIISIILAANDFAKLAVSGITILLTLVRSPLRGYL